MPRKHAKPGWTFDEIRRVVSLWPTDLTVEEIAREIGGRHTGTAVGTKGRTPKEKGGLGLGRRQQPWTAGATRRIEGSVDNLIRRFAVEFGRSEGSIAHKINRATMTYAKRTRGTITPLGARRARRKKAA